MNCVDKTFPSGKKIGRPRSTTPEIDRFWAKVEKQEAPDGCWEWTAATRKDGYGVFGIWMSGKSKNIPSHRYSWEATYGAIPEGLFVCHKCDNPRCVRPDHLFLGTPQENIQDCARKKRFHVKYGSRNGQAKVTERDVIAIREMAKAGVRYRQIGEKYGLTKASIASIVKRRRWAHVA